MSVLLHVGISVAALLAGTILFQQQQQQQLSELSKLNFTTKPEFFSALEFSSCLPTCQTKWCNIYANILNATMKTSMDPCEDFYEYVCGNWNPSLSQYSYLSIQLENAHDIVQFALEEQNASSIFQSKSNLVQYMTDLYQDCVDASKREQFDMAALLRQLMGETQLSLFDTSKMTHSNVQDLLKTINSSCNSSDVEEWMDLFVEASLNGVDTIFKHVRVTNKEIYITFNDKPYELKNQNQSKEFEELKGKIVSFFKIEKPQWNSSLNYVLYEIIDFKLNLRKLYSNYKIIHNSNHNWNCPWSITYFLEFYEYYNSLTNFNWTLLFRKFANKTGTSTRFMADANVKVITQVVSKNFDLLIAITELISSTPIRVLKNAMAIDYIDELQSRNLIVTKQLSKVNPSEAGRLYLWRLFSYKDFELFLPLYTRMFVDYVGRERMRLARDQANEMMQNMKKTFGELLKEGWLDEQTRTKALEKVNAMQSMISHPDWIFDDTALDEEFGFESVGEKTYSIQHDKRNIVASYFNLLRIVQSAQFRKLSKNDSNEKERKFKFTFGGIGFNLQDSNYISITHALLLDPSFNVDYPIGLNYGNLGTTISHEIVHGFDKNGIKHDKRGEIVNWWTDAAAQNYENRSQCFVQQYNKFGGNGTLTLGENIADNGGLNLAYRLFEKHITHSEKHCNVSSSTLPSFLGQFSHEKLFFLAYGLELCSHRNYATNWHPTDTHSALKYRVNIPLQNSDKFAQTFNCPVGSKMNPEHKCLLW